MVSIKPNIKLPKTKRGLETFHRICKSAEKLFHEKTYHGATINDIVDDAGLGVGTFYIYFDSKQELYRYLVLSYYHDIRSTIAIQSKYCKTRLEFERAGLISFLHYVIKRPQAYTIIWQALLVDRALFIDYYTSFAQGYSEQLEKSVQNGEINPELDITALAYALMGISNFLGLETIFFHKQALSETEIEKMVDTILLILKQGFEPKRA